MKRSLNLILAAAMSVALFSGCNDKNVSKYIPDGSSITDSTVDNSVVDSTGNSAPPKTTDTLDTVVTDGYKYDFISNMFDSCIITDKYIYFDGVLTADGAGGHFSQDYKVDLQTGEMIPLCNVPDCDHWDTNTKCESFVPLATIGDKGYALKRTGISESNKIIDESGNVVFENKFASDLDMYYAERKMDEYDSERKEYDEDDVKYDISGIWSDEKHLYIAGANYIYAYDIETGQATEPLIIDEDLPCSVLGADMENKKLYYSNEVNEVFIVDLANQTFTKVYDGQIYDLMTYNGKIYYARFLPQDPEDPDSPETAKIFEADPDFKNEKMLIDDCANVFVIKDDKIFYFDPFNGEENQEKMIYSYDMKTGESKELFSVEGLESIVTAPYIDRIFAMGLYTDRTGIDTVQNTTIISFRPDGSDIWTNEGKNQEALY